MHKGFTLIELLVVVLIIGILSSVALPQYQKAVEKSRLGSLMPTLKALRDAEAHYYLANGNYTENIQDLAVSLAGCQESAMGGSVVGTGYACGNYAVRIYASGAYAGDGVKPAEAASVMIEVYTKPNIKEAPLGWEERWSGGKKESAMCYALRNNTTAESVCKSMGGVCGNTYGGLGHRYCPVN